MRVPGRLGSGYRSLWQHYPRPQGTGTVWVGGLWASRPWSYYLGITASWRHLGQDYKQCPLPWLSGTPKSPAYCPKASGRGRQLGGEWLQPVFPINIPKWPLAGSGRAGREGRGGLRHPRAQGPCLAARRSPFLVSVKPQQPSPSVSPRLGVLSSKGERWSWNPFYELATVGGKSQPVLSHCPP